MKTTSASAIIDAYERGYNARAKMQTLLLQKYSNDDQPKHASWIDKKCSICGEEAIIEWNETGGAWIMTPYCPWCGAEMDNQ